MAIYCIHSVLCPLRGSQHSLSTRFTPPPGEVPLSVTTVKVRRTLQGINPDQAAGPDNIPGWLLRDCAHQLSETATIIPIPTSSTVTSLNDYRPVALNLIALKCFERLVMTHVKDSITVNSQQYACHPGSQTLCTWTEEVEHLESWCRDNNLCINVKKTKEMNSGGSGLQLQVPGLLIMCGNLLVIISIIYFKQLHTPTNYLILSLAVADLLVGVVVLPFSTILVVTSCWYLKDLLYRYYAVCQPLSYRTKMNVRAIVVMILLSWTGSAHFGIGITIQGLNEGQSIRCVLFQQTRTAIIGIFFAFYLPAIIMFSIYVKIFTVAQRQARSIQNTTCKSKKSGAAVSKSERKATKTLAVVIGVFLICWTPFHLCMTFYHFSNYPIPVPLIETLKWLGWSNSMLNPLVYGFFYRWFRSSFRMIISGKIFQDDFTNSKLF
ncbi:trace amine-associated receptor 1-like [Centropristis striata]|uniref:trace amine-associated receptor 1-like n=1 Tax=Centropristis striata TaxID=184440 RepID=UPI0027DF796C|nr:trace amine-associated receptor 1-like [Centropristis striata]